MKDFWEDCAVVLTITLIAFIMGGCLGIRLVQCGYIPSGSSSDITEVSSSSVAEVSSSSVEKKIVMPERCSNENASLAWLDVVNSPVFKGCKGSNVMESEIIT